jgi:alanine-synthesizing transaminase
MRGTLSQVREISAAKRLERVRYAIRDLAVLADDLARQGKQILPLNIGDPLLFDFCTPPHLIEAVLKAMRDGHNGYAPSLGVDVAIEAIRAEAEQKGFQNIESIFITEGVSEAVDLSLAGLIGPGDNVLTPCPEYPLYGAVLAKLGAQVNSYRLDESRDWEPDVEHLASRVTKRTRGLILINPNNPTGAVYSRPTLEAIAEIARQHNLVIFADQIYDELVLDQEAHISIASLAPDLPVVTFNGLSKACLAPGWRVGWAVVSGGAAVKPYVEGIHKLLRARLCANHPLQYAIPVALQGSDDFRHEALDKLRARRDLLMAWATATPGVHCVRPRGAFYAFPRLDIRESDESFVKSLLAEKHVLVVHGSGFGQSLDARHIRIVFLPQEDILRQALNKIGAFLQERRP